MYFLSQQVGWSEGLPSYPSRTYADRHINEGLGSTVVGARVVGTQICTLGLSCQLNGPEQVP